MLSVKVPENYIKYCIVKENKAGLDRLRTIGEQCSIFITRELLKRRGMLDSDIDNIIEHLQIIGPGQGAVVYDFSSIGDMELRADIYRPANEFIRNHHIASKLLDVDVIRISTGYEILTARNELTSVVRDNKDTIGDMLKDFTEAELQLELRAHEHPIFGGAELPKYISLNIKHDVCFLSSVLGNMTWPRLKQLSPELYNKALDFVGTGGDIEYEVDEIRAIMNL